MCEVITGTLIVSGGIVLILAFAWAVGAAYEWFTEH